MVPRLPFQDVPVDTTTFADPPPIDKIASFDIAGNPRLITSINPASVRVTVNVNVINIHLITCHLKSELLTFPGGQFSMHNGNFHALFAAIALIRRAAEAGQI